GGPAGTARAGVRRPALRRPAWATGPDLRRRELRRPVPHLRHPHRPARLGDRAALLLRPALEPRPAGARAPLPRGHVPDRLAGAAGLRPGFLGGDRGPGPADPA